MKLDTVLPFQCTNCMKVFDETFAVLERDHGSRCTFCGTFVPISERNLKKLRRALKQIGNTPAPLHPE